MNPYAKVLRKQELRTCISTFFPHSLSDNKRICAVHQERVKAKKEAKKPKVQKAAGDAFLKTLFAP